jgi:cystathionine beta-lyase
MRSARMTVGDFAASRLGWNPDPARIFALPDVMTGISEMITALTPPGAGVVISPPVYAPFFFRIGFTGRRVVEAPLRRRDDGGYELDAEALDRALSQDGVSAYVLCSPHNPVGRVWTAQELTTVADICHTRGVLVLADEIHAPLVLPGAAQVPFLSLDHPATARAIAFTSASKGWNIPGLKCGLAIAGSPELAAELAGRWEALLPGCSACTPRSPRSSRPPDGWTRSRSWTATAACWAICWPDLRRSATGHPRPASWPGWTAASWAAR